MHLFELVQFKHCFLFKRHTYIYICIFLPIKSHWLRVSSTSQYSLTWNVSNLHSKSILLTALHSKTLDCLGCTAPVCLLSSLSCMCACIHICVCMCVWEFQCCQCVSCCRRGSLSPSDELVTPSADWRSHLLFCSRERKRTINTTFEKADKTQRMSLKMYVTGKKRPLDEWMKGPFTNVAETFSYSKPPVYHIK